MAYSPLQAPTRTLKDYAIAAWLQGPGAGVWNVKRESPDRDPEASQDHSANTAAPSASIVSTVEQRVP